MKKIFFVTDSLSSGGAERVMSVLANEFIGIGYDVTIISKAHIDPFYPLNKKIKIIYPNTIINYSNNFTAICGRLNIYKNLFSLLKSNKPDVVISFRTITNGPIILMCKVLGIKVIASEHTNYKVEFNRFTYFFIKRFIYKLTDVLTVLTEIDKKEYYGKFLRNVVVMPNPLPLKPILQIHTETKKNIILAIGEISRWQIKGFDNLIIIYSKIAQKYPDWDLVIAGSGDSKQLNDMIIDLNLSHRVSLVGEIKDIKSLMNSAKIFALTSRFEGLPMVLIEAMSQGLPCLAFNCFTGPGEIINDGIDGLLVNDQNISEFSSKLSILIEDSDLRLKLGYNAIETSKRYNKQGIAENWEKIIDQLIQDKNKTIN